MTILGAFMRMGIAANAIARADQGFERIDQDRAIKEMCNRGDVATSVTCIVTIDDEPQDHDRFEIARRLKRLKLL